MKIIGNLCKTRNMAIIVALSFCVRVSAANTAVASGAWETGANWSLGTAPLATDAVVIPAGVTITVKLTGDVCASLTIAATGSLVINSSAALSVGGSFTNAGSFTSVAGASLTFNGSANSIITGGGSYSIAGVVVLNLSSKTTLLDIQDANFISGINLGGKYFVNFKKGTWKMNNPGTLNDCYNVGSTNAITIPFGVVIEADAGTMNLGRNAPTGNATLAGGLFVNGGTVNIQLGQSFNSGQDFQYHVNGGTPQLYMTSGSLNFGAGFNAYSSTDYIDFLMTGGTLIAALNGYSNWITFQLADNVGGKTFMSGGTIILQDATNANIEDLDMGGANVAATQYSVTGGTVQLGYVNTQSSSSFFGVNAQSATNYPNIDFEAGVPKYVSAFTGGTINMLSLYVNPNMTFDATGFTNVNIIGSNGTFALDDEGGFIRGTSTITFSGSVNQLIRSVSLATDTFYNLTISKTAGNVTLGVPTVITNQLTLNSGLLDASNNSIMLSSGNVAIKNASQNSYIITGDGVVQSGQLKIKNIPVNTATLFPIGTANRYLPFTINPAANAGQSYSSFVFTGLTTNALADGPSFGIGSLSKMLNAEWNIQRTSGTGNSTLAFNWAYAASALEGTAFHGYGLNIGISQYSSGAWQVPTGSGNTATQSATTAVNNFSQFAIAGNSIILSTQLVGFDVYLKNKTAALISWSISDPGNMQNTQVQKSVDGISWTNIENPRIVVNTNAIGNYSAEDLHLHAGLNYYRLLMNGSDGAIHFSEIKSLNVSFVPEINIFPNPASSVLTIAGLDENGQYSTTIYNSEGKQMWSSDGTSGSVAPREIDIHRFPAGIYYLHFSSKQNGSKSIRFVVIR